MVRHTRSSRNWPGSEGTRPKEVRCPVHIRLEWSQPSRAPLIPTVALPPPSALSPAAECTGSVTWQSRAPAWGASWEGSQTPSGSNSEGRGRRRKPALLSSGVERCPSVLQGSCGTYYFVVLIFIYGWLFGAEQGDGY